MSCILSEERLNVASILGLWPKEMLWSDREQAHVDEMF
jgi:hypothetical protein